MKFRLKKTVCASKLGLKAYLYEHTASKHTHLHVRRAGDSNNAFALAFKTAAPDRTGLPHILEHTTLCGSKKFPVRDPFFKMLSRSLANFMNAMTGADYTYFPFATTNKQDFKNLQNVYMDSVFNPLLRKADFLQEGWRLEPKNGIPDPSPDPSLESSTNPPLNKTDLVFKGVVYNEMKGQLSTPAYIHYNQWYSQVCPEMQCSGGDPECIVDLKHEDLVKFHQRNYTPNNLFTYSYGDFDADEVLTGLEPYIENSMDLSGLNGSKLVENNLNNLKSEKSKNFKLQVSQLTENVKKHGYGPVDPSFDESRQLKSSLTWFVPINSCLELLEWRVLNMLLLEGHSTPVYKALIDSGLGFEFSVNSGIEEVPNGLLFSIGLQGMDSKGLEAFKPAVFKVLNSVCTNGVSKDQIQALLHQLELSNCEIDANYGLGLLDSVVQRAVRREEYLPLIDTVELLDQLKQDISSKPALFESMIKTCLLDAKYIEFEMHPLSSFETDVAAKEALKLTEKVDSLTPSTENQVYTDLQMLKSESEAVENLDLLPTISTADVNKEIRQFPVTRTEINGIPVVSRDTNTAGVEYFRLLRDVSALEPAQLKYLPIYTAALTNIGTKKHDAGQLEELIRKYTGGISVSVSLRPWEAVELEYSSCCLQKNVDQMSALLNEVITSPDLANVRKLKVLVDLSAANVTNALATGGHRVAMSFAASQLSKHAAKSQLLTGIPFLKLVQTLANLSLDELKTELVPQLTAIHETKQNYRLIAVTGKSSHSPTDSPAHSASSASIASIASIVNGAAPAPPAPAYSDKEYTSSKLLQPGSDAFTVLKAPLQVSHVGAAVSVDTGSLLSPLNAALDVLATVMTQKYLHPAIREKGGAYGGGAKYNAVLGLFQLYSYRDPTPRNTQQVFSESLEWAKSTKYTDREIEEGKISVFQSLDAPISPRNEIGRAVYSQLTDSQRQVYRTNLINVDAASVHAAAALLKQIGAVCVVGTESQPGFNTISL